MDGTGDGEIGVCNYNSSTNIKSQTSPRGGGSLRNKETNAEIKSK